MKRFEMWKWFKLPVDCNLSSSEDDSDLIGIYEHDILSSHHVEKVEIAINSYDQHIELIAKQEEQIKIFKTEKNASAITIEKQSEQISTLRNALEDIITKSEIFGIPSGVIVPIINGLKVLSATEKK